MIPLKDNLFAVIVPKEATNFEFICADSKYLRHNLGDIKLPIGTIENYKILLTVTKDEILGDPTILPAVYELLQKNDVWFMNPIPEPEMQGGYDENGNGIGGYDPAWIDAYEAAQNKVVDKVIIIKKV